jgi:hypothetical protein
MTRGEPRSDGRQGFDSLGPTPVGTIIDIVRASSGAVVDIGRTLNDFFLHIGRTSNADHNYSTMRVGRGGRQRGWDVIFYKYFLDVEAILVAWHERHVQHHLRSLTEARDRAADPGGRLEAVLESYAAITYERAQGHRAGHTRAAHAEAARHARERHAGPSHSHERHSGEIAALVHRSEHVAGVEAQLIQFVSDVLQEAAKAGKVRRDVPPHELARFCLDALGAARALPSRPAVRRLVAMTLAWLRPTKGRA